VFLSFRERGIDMGIIEQVTEYLPYNEQEEKDKCIILNQLQTQKDIFSRDNRIAHMTASAWVVNRDKTKVLMIYHNIYNSWSWLGGHADGEESLIGVAMREVKEESGLKQVRPVTNKIYSLETLTVDGHEKKGVYVSSHLHLNITYLIEASEEEALSIKPDENSGVLWFELEEAIFASTEPWFQKRVYRKLNEKLSLYISGK